MRFAARIPMFALCLTAGCVLRTPSLSSSLGASASLPSPGMSAPPAEETSEGGIIEAGCSFAGRDLKGEPGTVHQLTCPAGCGTDGNVYGTDIYTNDTPVCAAAMHAGMISRRGGEATVVVDAGRPAYRGTKRNGIASRDWGSYPGSFRFEGPRVMQAAPEVARAPSPVDAGCTFEGRQLEGDAGKVFRVSCPSGCKAEHGAWGTETYAGHSRVCVAAIHAGLISDERGGEFTLILGDRRPAFRGSKRNGIESGDWGAFDRSFQLQK